MISCYSKLHQEHGASAATVTVAVTVTVLLLLLLLCSFFSLHFVMCMTSRKRTASCFRAAKLYISVVRIPLWIGNMRRQNTCSAI